MAPMPARALASPHNHSTLRRNFARGGTPSHAIINCRSCAQNPGIVLLWPKKRCVTVPPPNCPSVLPGDPFQHDLVSSTPKVSGPASRNRAAGRTRALHARTTVARAMHPRGGTPGAIPRRSHTTKARNRPGWLQQFNTSAGGRLRANAQGQPARMSWYVAAEAPLLQPQLLSLSCPFPRLAPRAFPVAPARCRTASTRPHTSRVGPPCCRHPRSRTHTSALRPTSTPPEPAAPNHRPSMRDTCLRGASEDHHRPQSTR